MDSVRITAFLLCLGKQFRSVLRFRPSPCEKRHREHGELLIVRKTWLSACKAEIRLFCRFVFDRNQFGENRREFELLRTEADLVSTTTDKPVGVELGRHSRRRLCSSYEAGYQRADICREMPPDGRAL